MRESVIALAYLLSAILFILGIKGLTNVRTARRGNLLGASAMLIAILTALVEIGTFDVKWILAGLAVGGLIGAVAALRVQMTSMPEMVALLNGFGGGASALVASSVLYLDLIEPGLAGSPADVLEGGAVTAVTVVLSIMIGAITLSGSIVAFLKLSGRIGGKPVLLPGRHVVNALLFVAAIGIGGWMAFVATAPAEVSMASTIVAVVALVLGVMLVIPIGGADMPVVISLLNSYSGVAAAMTGFVLGHNLLIIAGALVGASGLILTKIMCVAMNRTLANVIFGGFGAEATTPGGGGSDEYTNVRSYGAEDAALILENAETVIFVPGYGLAVAQAQHTVRELADLLEKNGAEVKYAIHPVAGRMPGHMNVLLAEADVPYEQLIEMDRINPEFKQTDVTIAVGANDVVNPAAQNDPGSPIAGMPILEVFNSQTVDRHQAEPEPRLRRHQERALRVRQHHDGLRRRQAGSAGSGRRDEGDLGGRLRRPLAPVIPRRLVALLLSLLTVGGTANAAEARPASGRGGAVASGEADATRVGLEILRLGGNAVDAAVATALALAVVHPEAGNLGGGGFAVLRFEGELYSLDFRETAPAAATADMYLDDDGEPRPRASWVGPLATAVPGSPHGLWELHRRFGSLPWRDLVEPAIQLASGFIVSERLAQKIEVKQELLASYAESARVFLPDGRPPAAGSKLVIDDLRRTLERYSELGPPGITEGAVAEAVEATVARHGGVLTARDLAAYRSVWRPPLEFGAFGWSFASMDLPSTGGILLAQSLQMLNRLGWSSRERFGADRTHLTAEVWRLAYADRYLLGDPATTEATAADLLSPAWLNHRASGITLDRARPSRDLERWPGRLEAAEGADTTHLSVADGRGNLVALTTTLNGNFGCGLLVPGAGFLLNNEMDDFTTAPGRPNAYDIIQGDANRVRPGRRMISSMAPTLAWRDNEALVVGGRGGSKIPTSVSLVILNLLVDGDDLQQAIARPRIHHQWMPDRILLEPDTLGGEIRLELERRGHTLSVELDPTRLPKVHAVRRLPSGGFEAAADPRGPGAAGVVEEQLE